MKLLVITCMLLALRTQGQQPVGFRTSVAAGLAIGQSGPAAIAQLGFGYQFPRLYTGIGGGYDRYRFDAYPVYAEARYYPVAGSGFYGYGHTGYSFVNTQKRSAAWGTGERWRNGGFYADLGAGYRFVSGRNQAFSFAAGYTVKNIRSTERFLCAGCEVEDTNTSIDKHRLSRILVKMIYEFNW